MNRTTTDKKGICFSSGWSIRNLKHIFVCLIAAFVFSDGVHLVAEIDSNGNGMSDVWERLYLAENADPEQDPDEDGQSNYLESLAGTDPFRTESVLKVTISNHIPYALIVSWQSANGVSYQVKSSHVLGTGNWENEGPVRLGHGGRVAIALEPPVAVKKFFRVDIVDGRSALVLGELSKVTYDADGDGQSDMAELAIGSDLFNEQSRLSEPEVSFGPISEITWQTQKGKQYIIQSRLASSTGAWENLGLPYSGTGDEMTATLVEPDENERTYNITVSDIDSDDDGLNDWEEYQVGLDPMMEKTNPLGLGDIVDLAAMLSSNNTVSVKASSAVANISRMENGGFELVRMGGVDEINVNFTISGSAVPDSDYQALSGEVTIPFGVNKVEIPVVPLAGSTIALSESVVINLVDGADYDLGQQTNQQVNVLKEVALNVTDYGAVGDGVTDDTAAIQAAILALEASTEHNTLFFPTGKYRLNTKRGTPYYTATSRWRILELGGSDLTGRDLIFVGEPDAILYATLSPTRVHMMMTVGRFRSLAFRGMGWEKDSVPLDAAPGGSPNGADGVSIVNFDDRRIESVSFDNCTFNNCQGAVWIYAGGYDNRGKIAQFNFRNNKVLNPFGCNTVNSELSWGGGLQVRVSSWVDYAYYEGNLFEGGGADMTDTTTSPGGTLKDASHYGSPLNLKFTNNIVRYMGYESIFQVNDNTSMGATTSGFIVPPADGVSTASVTMSAGNNTFYPGDIFNLRAPAGPGLTSHNNLYEVVSFDVASRNLTFLNTGNDVNVAPGVEITKYKAVYLDKEPDPTFAEISYNYFNGDLPLGALQNTNNYGIAINARSKIIGNVIVGWGIGVQMYDEVHTPSFPASRGSIIRNNYIRTRDTVISSNIYAHGIQSWCIDDYIEGNKIITPVGIRFSGITLRGANSLVENNAIWPITRRNNGYFSSVRATGIGVGDNAIDPFMRNNKTYGLDVGVGQLQPNGYYPHFVSGHQSFDDVVGVDPKATIVP